MKDSIKYKEEIHMTDKTRWLGLGPWHEDNESELIDWTAQPQYGYVLQR